MGQLVEIMGLQTQIGSIGIKQVETRVAGTN